MSRLILTIITIALFALRGECVMDARMFMYDHLGIEDGMLSQRVHSIVEDSNGDIWISTKNRVSRYNGRTLLNYQLNPDAIYSSAGGRVIKLMTMNNGDVVAYDNNGNIISSVEKAGTEENTVTYAYDKLNRISSGAKWGRAKWGRQTV